MTEPVERVIHAVRGTMQVAARSMQRDEIWFGAARLRAPHVDLAVPTAGIETIRLNDAYFSPTPFAVFDADGVLCAGARPAVIHNVSPDAVHELPALSSGLSGISPIATGAGVTLGRFLGEVLSVVLLQNAWLETAGLIGAPLTPAQLDAMACLDLLRCFTPVDTPVTVRRASVTRRVGKGGSRLDRCAIDALRFAAEPYEVCPRIALLSPESARQFSCGNRTALVAWLRARRFAVLDAAAMTLDGGALRLADIIAVLAAARIVVTDDPAQAALIGFCDPGSVVIELAIDGWDNPAIRTMAQLFALDWRMVANTPPSYPITDRLPRGAQHMLRTEVDLASLDRALAATDGGWKS